MAETIPAETLQKMVENYEEALRLLVSKADDEDSLYTYLRSPKRTGEVTQYEIARYETFREVGRIAARALREFHPEIRVA